MYGGEEIGWSHIRDRMAVFKANRKEPGQSERDDGGKRGQPSRTGSLGLLWEGGRGRGIVE